MGKSKRKQPVEAALPSGTAAAQSTQPTQPAEPAAAAEPKKKRGRPPKAPEERAVFGKTWHCFLDDDSDEAYSALLAAATAYDTAEKLALRRVNGRVEAFFGLASDKSAGQLSSSVMPAAWEKGEGTDWSRVLTAHGEHKWRIVRPPPAVERAAVDRTPVERAHATASATAATYGLRGLHISEEWVEEHVPAIQQLTASEPVLSAGGAHARLQS